MMARLGMVCVLVGAVAVQAQTSAPVPTPATPPVVAAEEDRTVVYTDDDRILYGADRHEVTPVQLFEALGRKDLLAKSQENTTKRRALLIAAGAVAVVGLAVGIPVLLTGPHFQTGRCNVDLEFYNNVCVPANTLHQVGGITAIAVGVVGGAILATFGWWSRPEVFTKYELQKFIDAHNASLAGGSAKPATTFKFELLPAVSPSFAGLVAQGSF